ncbi:penicillin-binding protein activator [uncultured Methylophaga sp.]|uniref:penicillin-binding protein activator n=1 Tax=uncultured Methylophaga sp. TaxID=285271 RepID=UPI002639F46C|nr:penicillin-binding protein activator [uncultured Methylophaga sp.]
MTLTRSLLLPAIMLLLLSACQPIQGPTGRVQPAEIKTLPAESEGQYQQAAQEYLQLAGDYQGEKQALYQLRAAQLFWQVGDVEQAAQALSQVDQSLLSDNKRFSAATLKAEIALFNSDGEAASQALTDFEAGSLSAEEQQQLLRLRSDAYTLTENWLEKANSHLALEKLLTEQDALAANREALWQALMQMTPQALDLYNPGYPPADDSGWFALAYAIKAYQDNPEAQAVALEDWRRSYPNHPADPDLFQQAIQTGASQLPRQVQDIAVLLPASGPFAEVAASIKQGIIAAHYASGSPAQLHFLDVDTDPVSGLGNVTQQYQQALSLGADVVIGPLQKASVESLAAQSELPVPVLALNRVDERNSRPNLFQFGLAPEDDAAAIADYARRQGYQHAVVLSPRGDWGDRVASAFNNAWQQQGGNVLYQSSYDESVNDFRDTLIPLMGLDVSESRYQTLKSTLGRSLDFEPRRRQDIDFLFLVARPLKARQLVPQLKFHRSGKLPLMATSHAYSGQPDPQQDIDLNDLIVTDIPWMLAMDTVNDPAFETYQQQSQNPSGSLLRLYAMGVDAYRLLQELNTLSQDPEQRYQGATGNLSVNTEGQVKREMGWGQFQQGYLEALP